MVVRCVSVRAQCVYLQACMRYVHIVHTVIVLIIEPVKNNYFSRNNVQMILYGSIIMGVIKEGVLTEAGSIIRTLTVVVSHCMVVIKVLLTHSAWKLRCSLEIQHF